VSPSHSVAQARSIVRTGVQRLTRRHFLAGVGAASGTLLAREWNVPAPAHAAASPKRGGQVTWGMIQDPVATIPFGAGNGSNFEITSLVYESLLGWDRNLKIVPALAESWDVPNDKTYIFHLRKGVKFHSGKELDANDVKYSLERQKSPPPPGADQGFYPNIGAVTVTDKYTVRVLMNAPDASLLGYLAWGRYSWIIPLGLYDRMDLRTHVDGTGPFKLDDYIPNDHAALSRFKDYRRPGLPYLDAITMKVMPDESARVAGLRSGAIDGATLTADSAHALAAEGSLQVLKGLTASTIELEYTLRGGKPWDNVKVRQAVNAAINRQEIIDKVYSGDGAYSGKTPPGFGAWPVSPTELKNRWEKYDLPKAKALMAEAGFANGFPVTLQTQARVGDLIEASEVLKAQLRQININLTVQPLEIGIFARNNVNGDFDWCTTHRRMRGDVSEFYSDFDPGGVIVKNWFKGGYSNAELGDLYLQGIRTVDEPRRRRIYRRIDAIVMTDWPEMPIAVAMKYMVVNKRLNNMYASYEDTERGLIEAWLT
jgi:peptide/nickel transport system substrate-binding protein